MTAFADGKPYMTITDNHINSYGHGIKLWNVAQFFVSNNLLYAAAHATGYDFYQGIYILSGPTAYATNSMVYGNTFICINATGYASVYGVYYDGNASCIESTTFDNNRFGGGAFTNIILLDAGVSACLVTDTNINTSTGGGVSDLGAGNVVVAPLI
jgi:nitrous oxidase accessory protein NosD